MKEYSFEYTTKGGALILFLISFVLLILVGFLLSTVFMGRLSAVVITIGSIMLSVLFFLLNKSRIKRFGVAKLYIDNLILVTGELTYTIAFNELKYYYIHNGKNGIAFTLGLIDGAKLKLGANNNFCNDDLLKTFLDDLQLTLENYKAEHKVNIIHLESVFARKSAIYVLIILTVLVIFGFCFLSMPAMIMPISVSVSLFVGWIRYFQMRNKNQLVDF